MNAPLLPHPACPEILDGNEAAARVAYAASEVVAIYPITPASSMGEYADEWAARGKPNLWGALPQVVEMQSEGGAAGAVHGALAAGALATSFTASQGLLLMIPNLYKIAGELTPFVLHVAARTLATHALSIFGDHSDVMAVRGCGCALLASGSVQEAADLAAIAHAATLVARVPFLHFFDGFRTSHELALVQPPADDTLRALFDEAAIRAHRERALTPEHPTIRGTAQNPDVFFQSREAANPYHDALPGLVRRTMDRYAELTGRRYRLFDYHGHPEAGRVLVLMGSGAETVHETVDALLAAGERVGVLRVRLYRPFAGADFVAALPRTTRAIAVLDRCKEPGAPAEPLHLDVIAALAQHGHGAFQTLPRTIGGRYGLSSKEFTPAMAKAVFDELSATVPRSPFTIGIHDDVTHLSLDFDPHWKSGAAAGVTACVFYGLGSDGTVSANKNSVQIIAAHTGRHAQGYFVYDSKKSGAMTVSHLRFGPGPIRSAYLIGAGEADFVACHQPAFLTRPELLAHAKPGATLLLNTPLAPGRLWASLPPLVRATIRGRNLRLYAIDAYALAAAQGMGRRINTVMQTAFFAISGVLPGEAAIAALKQSVEDSYGRKGRRLVEQNHAAIDATLAALHAIPVPERDETADDGAGEAVHAPIPADAPAFVRLVTAELLAGRGNELPVSALPADGSFPVGTARYEKRALALELPVWDEKLCIQCGKCPLVCPHAAIRAKLLTSGQADAAPAGFRSAPAKGKEYAGSGLRIVYQVAPEDCTGCNLCVEVCPVRDKSEHRRKALNMAPAEPLREPERANWAYFLQLPEADRSTTRIGLIRGAMLHEPLFEFSGACAGCGETPYLKLASQLFGDRMLVANATGCSSIYGGNLPTTPWAANRDGRGPAWANSLFEDNAEFGLGMRIALDQQREHAEALLRELAGALGTTLVEALLGADQSDEAGIAAQRLRVADLRTRLATLPDPRARRLEHFADALAKKSVWIVGGDGWAYDIGYGGLDHVLASDRDINILVLDTEVYSNTGGQTSKATPRGAVAKFSAGGKRVGKKDLALLAMDYGHVYVARVAFGAKDQQTLNAFLEAESWPGPSLILAYSPCIAHGVDLSRNLRQQELAVACGHWPLLRYDPRRAGAGEHALKLDSARPSLPFEQYARTEGRFEMLRLADPAAAERLRAEAQAEVLARYHHYEQLAGLDQDTLPEPAAGATTEEDVP